MEGDQVSQAEPLLTGPDQLVVLYLLCDGAQNDLFMTFPGTKISCQSCSSPSVLTIVSLLNLVCQQGEERASCSPEQQQNNTQTINDFTVLLRSPCKMSQTPSFSV